MKQERGNGLYRELMLFLIIVPFILLAVHILAIKLINLLKINISSQKLLAYCIFLLNLPVVLVSTCIIGLNNEGLIAGVVYTLMVYNSIAYCYFQVFNLSDTARRIKLLIGIKTLQIKNLKDINNYYDSGNILAIRLDRLEQLSQVKKDGSGSYILNGRSFYVVAHIIKMFRKILGIKEKK